MVDVRKANRGERFRRERRGETSREDRIMVRGRAIRRVGFAIAVVTLLVASQAQARPETLRFTYPDPSVVSAFRVYVGSAAGQSDLLAQTLSSFGTPDANGIYSVTIDVASNATVFIRMTAVGQDSTESAASNEIQRSAPLGVPGRPIVVVP